MRNKGISEETFDQISQSLFAIEKQIFAKCKIKPEYITNETVAPIISELRNFMIESADYEWGFVWEKILNSLKENEQKYDVRFAVVPYSEGARINGLNTPLPEHQSIDKHGDCRDRVDSS